MRRIRRSAIMACGVALAWIAPAAAAPAVPGVVVYSNGAVMGGDRLQLCTVDLVMVDSAGTETVEFQFLGSTNRFGFKISGGTFDAAAMTFTPYRIADANFAGARFDYRQAFGRRVLSGGQLLATLGESILAQDFYQAFFLGRFVVLVQRAGAAEATGYFVEQAPGDRVRRDYIDCMKSLASAG
jgi:hypothetical protein